MGSDGALASLRGAGVTLLGLGLAAGLLQVLQDALPSFQVRGWAQGLIALFVGMVVALLTVLRALEERRDAEAALRATLDRATACWPPRIPASLSPYDLGVHPTGSDPANAASDGYVSRGEVEQAIGDALEACGYVVVYGPAQSGKSRTAYEVVHRRYGDAKLVVPDDADGLRALLAHADELAAVADGPMVLWLDELPRFLAALQLDAIDRLVRPTARRERLPRRIRAWLRRRPRAPRPLRLVATLRTEELSALLHGDAGDDDPTARHRLRRLIARGRGIALTARDPAQGIPTDQDPFPGPRGWPSTPLPALRRQRRRRRPTRLGVLAWLLGGLALALAVVIFVYGHAYGLTEAPPLAQQIDDLATDAPECEQLSVLPRGASKLSDDDVLVVVARRSLCHEPDELRLYARKQNDRLERIVALSPPPGDSHARFRCIGTARANPCRIAIAGRRVVIGAFTDGATQQALPIALRFVGDEHRLTVLSPRPPKADAPGYVAAPLRRDRKRVRLRLRAEGLTAEPAIPCASGETCLGGRRAQAWAALGEEGSRPALLLAGYLASGSTSVPESVRVRVWRLGLTERAAAVRTRCFVFTGGRRLWIGRVRISSSERIDQELASGWAARVRARQGRIVC